MLCFLNLVPCFYEVEQWSLCSIGIFLTEEALYFFYCQWQSSQPYTWHPAVYYLCLYSKFIFASFTHGFKNEKDSYQKLRLSVWNDFCYYWYKFLCRAS
jgi:hypothetical protein